MPDIPDALDWGIVEARFGAIVSDSADVDRVPDVERLDVEVILEPAVDWVRVSGPDGGIFEIQTLTCTTDEEGVLLSPDSGEAGVPVVATAQPQAVPAVIQWRVTVRLGGEVVLGPTTFDVPGGGETVRLESQLGTEEEQPYALVVSTADRVRAEAAADTAVQARVIAVQARNTATAAADTATTAAGEADAARDEAVTAANPPRSGTTAQRTAAPVVADQLWWDTDLAQMFMRVGAVWQAVTARDSAWVAITPNTGITGTLRVKITAGGIVCIDGILQGTFPVGGTAVGTVPDGYRSIGGVGEARLYGGAGDVPGVVQVNSAGVITVRNIGTGDRPNCNINLCLPLA